MENHVNAADEMIADVITEARVELEAKQTNGK